MVIVAHSLDSVALSLVKFLLNFGALIASSERIINSLNIHFMYTSRIVKNVFGSNSLTKLTGTQSSWLPPNFHCVGHTTPT